MSVMRADHACCIELPLGSAQSGVTAGWGPSGTQYPGDGKSATMTVTVCVSVTAVLTPQNLIHCSPKASGTGRYAVGSNGTGVTSVLFTPGSPTIGHEHPVDRTRATSFRKLRATFSARSELAMVLRVCYAEAPPDRTSRTIKRLLLGLGSPVAS
eukprot:2656842-Rhodomonas_salina.2